MIDINQTPTDHTQNSYEMVGDSVDELIEECLKRIRNQSQAYYKKELRKDLEKRGFTYIDVHAGMGNSYKVYTREAYRDKCLTEITRISQQLNLYE